MKKLLFLFFSAMFIVACDEKTTDDTLSVNREVLEFAATGGTAEFQIITEKSWQILIADEKSNVALSAKMGTGNATITVTLPLTNSIQDVETRLIVRADDGSSIRNVVLRQKGHLVSGTTLEVTNWSNIIAMDGYAHAEDSLTISSNVPWQLKGPEWIEAYNGTTWVKLSPERAMISGPATVANEGKQTVDVKIRCVSDNNADDDRNGTLILESAYESSKSVRIDITQLGRYNVEACQVQNMAHSLAWTWKCGKDVGVIKVHVDTPEYGNTITSESFNEWNTSAPGYVCAIDGLKPNTQYSIYSIGLPGDGSDVTVIWHSITSTTRSDVDQPLAAISNLDYVSGKFKWLVTQNEFSYGFFQMILTDPALFELNDGYIGWYFSQLMHDSETTKDYPMYTYRQKEFEFSTDYHIQIVTWCTKQGDLFMSSMITRFDTSKDWTRSATDQTSVEKPRFVSRPYNMEEFKKSVIIIKK